jgi:phosphomannomutase
MTETDALLGGESSGGMSVRGHVHGKDGIYAAALLVEMLAVTGRKISQIYEEILNEYGRIVMVEHNYRFRAAMKPEYTKIIMEDRKVPELPFEIDHISYMDGCKVYFANGGWVSVRFSGTEPLLRIFCEMPDKALAKKTSDAYKNLLGLSD